MSVLQKEEKKKIWELNEISKIDDEFEQLNAKQDDENCRNESRCGHTCSRVLHVDL